MIVTRLSSDHGGPEPGLQAALLDWIICSPTSSAGCRLVAAAREPPRPADGRLRLLDLAPALSSASATLAATIGQAADLVPFAIFLHVFLAFPTRSARGPAGAGSGDRELLRRVGLQLVGLMLGGFDPENLLAIFSEPDAAATLAQVQLAALAAISLGGVGVLAARRRAGGARCAAPPRCSSTPSRSPW